MIYKAFWRMKVCFKSLTNFHTFLHFLLYGSIKNPSSVSLKNESEILLFICIKQYEKGVLFDAYIRIFAAQFEIQTLPY